MFSIYKGSIWRPPSEARSLILQATIGCSNNACTFCGSYKNKKFRIKPLSALKKDVTLIKNHYKNIYRIFLADGDALVIKTEQLVDTLDYLYNTFSQLERVGLYASPQNLLQKSKDDLRKLKEHGLGIIYLGVETGLDILLKKVKKGVTRDQMIQAGTKAVESGIPLSVTIIIGLGGPELSEQHAIQTAFLLNKVNPEYVGALTLMVVEGTELYKEYKEDTFSLLKPGETLQEMYGLIENLECSTIFRSNHASNYVQLGGDIPEDKPKLLHTIKAALAQKEYKSEYLRGL